MSTYARIDHQTWGDEKFRALSDPGPNAKTLWLYLLTGPHNLSLPGLWNLSRGDLMDRLGNWDREGFDRAWGELEDAGLAHADWDARCVYVPNVLRRDPPESPNLVRSWWRVLGMIPECELAFRAISELIAWCDRKGTEWGGKIRAACRQAMSRRSLEALGLWASDPAPVPESAPVTESPSKPLRGKPRSSGIRSPVSESSPPTPPPAGGLDATAWPEARDTLAALRLAPTDPSPHRLVIEALEPLGWRVRADVVVRDGGRGRKARLALLAERDGTAVAIEFSATRPGVRPLSRLRSADATHRVLLLRDGRKPKPPPQEGVDLVSNLASPKPPPPVRGSQDYVPRDVPVEEIATPKQVEARVAALKRQWSAPQEVDPAERVARLKRHGVNDSADPAARASPGPRAAS